MSTNLHKKRNGDNSHANEEKIQHMEESTLDVYGDVEHDDDPDTGLPFDDPLPVDDEPYLEPERVKEFTKRFHAGWKKTAEGYMEAAQALLDAKAELKHGDFGKMVKRELGLKPKSAMRTAQMLMEVAANPVLKAKKFSPLLPRNWTTAHKLTGISDVVLLEKLFTDGIIQSDMLGHEADALVDQHRQDGHVADLAVLNKLAEKWQDPTPLAEHTTANLAAWIEKYAACLEARAKADPVQPNKVSKKRNGQDQGGRMSP